MIDSRIVACCGTISVCAYFSGAQECVVHQSRQPDALEAVVGTTISHLDYHLLMQKKKGGTCQCRLYINVSKKVCDVFREHGVVTWLTGFSPSSFGLMKCVTPNFFPAGRSSG
jgi:hypothetical protein